MAWRRACAAATAIGVLVSGCANRADVDLGKLDIGPYSTAARVIPQQSSLPNGVVLEGIRMSDAVADTSAFGSPLIYLWDAGPVTGSDGLTPIVGAAATAVLARAGWVTGYRVRYADTAQPPNGNAPHPHVGLSIILLRFTDDAAARRAASTLEAANWSDFSQTIAAPLPRHPAIAARYIAGAGTLSLDTAIGPFVLRLTLEAPPGGIEKRIGELDAAVDEETTLLRTFTPTPVAEIPALTPDPDGLLARMVATDPAEPPPPSPAFATFGPTGALRDQSPTIRRDRMYEKWGVDRLAVSGDQRLYRARDHQAANDMAAELIRQASGVEREIDGAAGVPDTRCFQSDVSGADAPVYSCRLVFDDVLTVVHAADAQSAKEMAAAQYVLLATSRDRSAQ